VALAGALDPIGPAGGPPSIPINLVGDFGGGSLYLVVGILAALREADRTGRGQVVDAAIVDGAAHLTTLLHGLRDAGLWHDRRGTNLLDGGAPFYAVYETADGRHVAVGALEPQFFAELVRRLELPDAPGQFEVDRWPELRAMLAARFAGRTRDEWAAHFAGSDACVSPVLSLGEAPGHEHLTARGTFVERHGTVQPAPAPRFSATPAELDGPPPRPGQHTRAVLTDWDVPDAEALLASGAVSTLE
jgi:alpha-methylacyl-CoA racemase